MSEHEKLVKYFQPYAVTARMINLAVKIERMIEVYSDVPIG